MRFSGSLALLALARLGLAAPLPGADVEDPTGAANDPTTYLLGALGLRAREEQHKRSALKRRDDTGLDAAGAGAGGGAGSGVVEESALLRARPISRRADAGVDAAGALSGDVDGAAVVRARKADDGEDYEDGEHDGEGHGHDEDEEYNGEEGDNGQDEYDNGEDEGGDSEGDYGEGEGKGETEQDGQGKGKGGKSKSKGKGKGKKTKFKGKGKSHDGESKCHVARHSPCLYPDAVDTLVNAYVRMLSKWNDTDAKYLADGFVDTSDSINILAGIPLGSPTFPTKQAFIDHQHTQVSPSAPSHLPIHPSC
jgi:hypothetical protein